MSTIDSLLQRSVERAPQRPALRWRDAQMTYAALDDAVETCARVLRDAGVTPHDRVAITPGNTPETVVQLFATWRHGAIAVPRNERLRTDDLRAADSAAAPTVRVTPDGAVERHEDPGDPSDAPPGTALILTTSGSTGHPKPVLVHHEREVETAASFTERLDLGADDVTALAVSVAHAFGLSCLLAAIASGGACVLVDSTTSTAPLVEALQHATIVHGSPTLFASLAGLRAQLPAQLRSGLCAGASAPPSLLERMDERELRILNLYGTTELGATAATRRGDDDVTRWTTSGTALAGHELRIVDGELHVRGPHVSAGYFRQPERTAAAHTDDGWFRTGDLAELDRSGHLRVLGRLDDVVSVAGFTVSPAEVEATLLGHPGVLEAVVVPVADERLGHRLAAFAVPRPESALAPRDLVAHVRQRLAGYKVPYRVELADDLPRLATGKPDRQALRARAADARG